MIRSILIALALVALPLSASAQSSAPTGTHQHKEGEKGPHGGVLQDIAGYEGELMVGSGKVVLYLIDHATGKPVETEGMKASVLLVQGTNRKGTIALNPSGDKLEGAGDVPSETDAVVSLRLANGKSGQARFELGGHKH